MIFLILFKGIEVSGKVAIFSVLAPYFLFLVLFLRIIFLDGSIDGIAYILRPNFKYLLDFRVWQNALTQSFFTNNIGYGTILTFACFRQKDFPVQKSNMILILCNILSALMSSLVVFGYLGYFSKINGIPIEELPLDGASLIFVTYPASLAMMPFPRFWLALFFFTLIFLAIDSQLGCVKTFACFLIDLQKRYNQGIDK